MNITTLEIELNKLKIPDVIQLDQATTITNCKECVKTHLEFLKHNSGKRVFLPYYDRLIKIYNLINHEIKSNTSTSSKDRTEKRI